jgi:hypothetical protein
MQTARRDTLAAENFGVLRIRRTVFNANSTVGGMVTSRLGPSGRANLAAGLDAVVRPFGEDYLTLKWVQTWTTGNPNPLADWAQSRMLVRWERRNQTGLGYAAELIHSGAGYDPAMGFTFRSNFTSLEARPAYRWLLGSRTPFRAVTVSAPGQAYWRNADGTVESAEVAPALGAELKSGEELGLTVRTSYESIRSGFVISGGAQVVPGDYWFHQVEFRLSGARNASFRPTVQVSGGSFFDGTRIGLSARPAWNPSRYLELGLDYDYNRVRFTGRDERLDLHVVRLRIQTALDVHLSLATLVQYDNAADAIGVNARLRYNVSEGRDFWVVFNETLNTDRPRLVSPRLPLTQSRAVLVKYTHTLGL